jgi:hypothetical protein
MKNEKTAAIRARALQAENDLAWHEAKLPPPMTPKQFTALLDELCGVGCCKRRRRQGETVYVISVSQIQEGDLILYGDCRASCDPLRTAILAAIGQLHSIDIDLEQISKFAPPEALDDIAKTRAGNREAIAALHARLYEDEPTPPKR